MTTITDEARKKLKTIMSTKLIEMVGHCENELPDYVVSMIANNKTKEYMKKNLEVFIGAHSEAFSDWLMDLKSKMNPSARVESSTPEYAEDDHVELHVNEPEPVKLPEPKVTKKRELLVAPPKASKKASVLVDKVSDDESHTRKRKRIEYDVKADDTRKSRSDRRDTRDERKRSSSRDRTSRKTTRDSQERRRRERSKTWSDDEFGEPIPAAKKVASSITVARPLSPVSKTVSSSVSVKRKISTDADRTAKTRSNIFFRAMNDATQLKPKVATKTSVKVTSSSAKVSTNKRQEDTSNEAVPTVARPTADGATVKVRLDLEKAPLTNVDSQKAGTKRKIVWDLNKADSTSNREASSSSRNTNLKVTSKNADVSSTASPERPKSLEDQENEAAIDAFIAATNLEMEMMKTNGGDDEDEVIVSDSDEPAAKQIRKAGPGEKDVSMETQLDKSKTKCSFWPACKRGSECEYVHPTVACTKFPRCVFGKQCLFVHPPCRFGDGCRNPNCPATHGDAEAIDEVKKLLGIETTLFQSHNMHLKRDDEAGAVVAKPLSSEIPCRFRNMCKNPSCPYKHPAECRYGANCLLPQCIFRHPAGKKPVATVHPMAENKYKWKASA